jgi:hypothetical protein
MAKLNISGYKKIEGLRIGDWVCGLTSETEQIYTFLFTFMPNDSSVEHSDFFNLVTMYRTYEDPDGFRLEVDFNIIRSNGYVEKFPKVNEKWIYSYELITIEKFKKLIEPLLKISA